ncbi:MAG: TonB-dependent receptor [Bacteroidota bacterium]|nr:TonB-dependent receptor [Bacteroidota bacterium]
MKHIFLIALILPFLTIAQERNHGGGRNFKGFGKDNSKDYIKGNISGKIIDSTTGKALEYANISLTNTKWAKIIEGTITDSKGRFYINKIRSGEYQISVSYVGYDIQNINFELTKKKPDIKLPDILLIANAEMLSEVTIEEQKAIFENKIDKIVYNAENDMNEGLNDATDVLRKAPLLTVDLEGEVSLRGSKNIKFLVNGKASSFFTSDIATALQMIPADEIKSVEIITSPGAKYDGEGDAGVVNIITKRKAIDGYKSTVGSAFGTRMNRQNANLSLGKGRFGLSARGGGHWSWPRIGDANSTREDWDPLNPEDINTLIDSSNTFSQWIGYRGSVNMFYDINAYNSIMSDIRISGRNSFSNDSSTYWIDGDTTYSYDSYIEMSGEKTNIEWSTDYIKTFADNEEQELSMSFQIGGSLGDDYINNDKDGIRQYNTDNDEKEIEYTLQLDYTHPFLQENKLEIGAKFINRDREIVNATISDLSVFRSPQDVFNYNQKVLSSYISSDMNLTSDIGLKAGVRYEETIISGDWQSANENSFEHSYRNILPSLTVAKEFSQTESLKLSYNNRISRPGIKHVNPSILRTNNFSITEGNPNLFPASTHQIEMGYNNFGKKYQGSYSVYAKHTIDIIESYTRIDTIGIATNKFENIGSSTTYGFNYFGSLRFDKLNIRSGFNLYQYTGSGNIDNEDLSLTSNLLYSYNFGGTYDLGKRWKIEGWGFFRSPAQTIQGTSTSFSMMSFGIKKDFKNKRGSLGMHIIEPFNKYKIFTNEINGENFTLLSERHLTFRSIGISFKYTFGKLNFKTSNKQSNIKNDDIKEESNDEM